MSSKMGQKERFIFLNYEWHFQMHVNAKQVYVSDID